MLGGVHLGRLGDGVGRVGGGDVGGEILEWGCEWCGSGGGAVVCARVGARGREGELVSLFLPGVYIGVCPGSYGG